MSLQNARCGPACLWLFPLCLPSAQPLWEEGYNQKATRASEVALSRREQGHFPACPPTHTHSGDTEMGNT